MSEEQLDRVQQQQEEEINEEEYLQNEKQEHDKFRETMRYVIPDDFKKLKCCKICGLIKDEDQFFKEGCDNCVEIFGKDEELFTKQYTGIMSLLRPDRSYIARYYGLKSNHVVGSKITS